MREQAARALRAGATHYTDRAGLAEVRVSLSSWLGAGGAEQVIVTAGLQEGLFLALRTLLAPSSTVARVGEPSPTVGFDALLDSLGLVAVDGAGEGLVVFEGKLVRLYTAAGVVTIGDFGFAGLGGWGVGYLAGPPAMIDPMIELKQGLNICTAAVSQHAAAAAARETEPFVAEVGSVAVAGPQAGNGKVRSTGPAPGASVSDDGTRQRYELLDLLASTPGAITLGRGDPDLATPAPIVEAAIAAMELPAREPDPLGLPELRRAIAAKLAADNGVVADPEREILVTTGGQEAIFLVLQTLLEPGDEILMPSPRYTSYDVAVNVAAARIVDVAPPEPLDFSLDVEAIEAAITPRTRALLIISPGNPTAAVADRERLRAVCEVARRHGLMMISDEMYERIVYEGAVHTSIASLPHMRESTITVGGFSKAYAMTGWRVGYLAAPAPLVAAAARLKRLWSGPTSQIAQHGALAALTHPDDLSAPGVSTYARRRALTLEALRALGLPHAPAQGAFYVFFDISGLGLPSYELSRRLLAEAGVFLYPGSGFGSEWGGHMRLAWVAPDELLEQALTRIGDWIARHR